jgi:sporulation protein YlmC with PRC-barrel domain
MQQLKLVRLIGAVTMLAATPALLAMAAHAQATSPPSEQAPMVRPERPMLPTQPPSPQAQPSLPDTKPATDMTRAAPGGTTPGAAASKPADPLIGLAVFGSDGQKIGEVQKVKSDPAGAVQEILVKTGGFMGFGGRLVAIPAGKFAKSGQNVQLAMTSLEVGKLKPADDKAS